MKSIIKLSVVAAAIAAILFVPGKIKVKENSSLKEVKVLGQSTVAETVLPASNFQAAPEFLNIPGIPQLTAKSAFAYDLQSGAILFTSNFQDKVQIASLTKLMTALVVVDNMDLNKVVTVQRSDTQVIGTNMGLLDGEQIRVVNLLNGLLIPSSNDAAKALARVTAGSESRFVDLMNAKAKALGMDSTNFDNPVGLDSWGNYSTAYDLSKLVTEFVKNPVLSEIVQVKDTVVESSDERFVHQLRTTNQLMLENKNVTGIKTGFTSLAKGNLIIRQNIEGAEVITIVLGSDNREEDSRRLINWLTSVYKW
jgi:serine-type D-Ala-D-Ala carboxypeptidase (penicillin-binding protein 5/6)